MNLATWPAAFSSVPVQTVWNLRITSAKSSGSSSLASTVEPTRSQNITVRWRRSASVLVGCEDFTSTEGAPRALKVRVAPQSPQNFFSPGFLLPQAGQRSGNAAPQCSQNLLPP